MPVIMDVIYTMFKSKVLDVCMDVDIGQDNKTCNNIHTASLMWASPKGFCDFFIWVVFQVSLRDPLRCGAEDHELREIIGAAVCTSSDYYC